MKTRNYLFIAAVMLAPLAASAATIATASPKQKTDYFAVFADGQKIGHAIRTRLVSGDVVTTTQEVKITMVRMGTSMTLTTSEKCVETSQGKPISFENVQDMGVMKQTYSGKLRPDGKVDLIINSAGQSRVRTMDWPQGALLLEGIYLLQKKHGLTEGKKYSFRQFMGSMMQAVDCDTTVGKKEKVDVLGRVLFLTKVDNLVKTPQGSMQITTYVDDKLFDQKTIQASVGMTMEIIACDKSFAMSKNSMVDFLAKTLLKSPLPASKITSATAAVYHLTPIGGKKLGQIATTGSQTVKGDGKGGYYITVTPAKAPSGATMPYKGNDTAALAALKPSIFIDSKDDKVVALAKKAVGDTKDAAQAAKKIESFVSDYIDEKSLAVGYASAAEVAASREGDCSEHAVLTAAMCQAAGIPARMTFGYVIAPNIGGRKNVFVGHAWTEAYIGDKWIPLDATRKGTTPGHITLSLSNGNPESFFAMINTIGYVKIAKITLKN